MSLQVRPGYVNPLTTMKENRNNPVKKHITKDSKTDKLTELRSKQQSLQSEMLLMKSTGSDSSGNTSEKLEALQKKLEDVSSDLRTAKNRSSGTVEKAALSKLNKTGKTKFQSEDKSTASSLKPDVDTYEKPDKESLSSGIYRLEADESRYKVSFSPYIEK